MRAHLLLAHPLLYTVTFCLHMCGSSCVNVTQQGTSMLNCSPYRTPMVGIQVSRGVLESSATKVNTRMFKRLSLSVSCSSVLATSCAALPRHLLPSQRHQWGTGSCAARTRRQIKYTVARENLCSATRGMPALAHGDVLNDSLSGSPIFACFVCLAL